MITVLLKYGTGEFQSILQKICNDLPQKPVVWTVQTFRKRQQTCVDKFGGH